MAFVFDPTDPHRQGMFSRAGRITSAKYVGVKDQFDTFSTQRKFIRVSSVPQLPIDLLSIVDSVKPIEIETEKVKPSPVVTSKKRSISPFSQQVSRESVERVKSNKHPPPPGGFYNPKFQTIHKTPLVLFKYDRERIKPRDGFTIRPDTSREDTSILSTDKQKNKIAGPILFERQTARERFYRQETFPNEDRFSYREIPNSSSRKKRVPSVSMNATTGRISRTSDKKQRPLLDYDANYEYGRKQLGTSGPEFQKRSGRKSLGNILHNTSNESTFNLNKTLAFKFSRAPEHDFVKCPPRDWDSKIPLPSFMQKGAHSRLYLEILSQKTLELNNFGEGKFQSVHSSFSPSTTARLEPDSKRTTWRS